jgi:hypothetical protein
VSLDATSMGRHLLPPNDIKLCGERKPSRGRNANGGSWPRHRRVYPEPRRPRASRSRTRAHGRRAQRRLDERTARAAEVVSSRRVEGATGRGGRRDGACGHGAAFQLAECGSQRPLSDRRNSLLTSGLSAPVSWCRRICRRTAFLRFSSARRRTIASTVISHGPQSEQSRCTAAPRDRIDAVRPQKIHTAISGLLTCLTRSPLLTALEGAGFTAPRAPRRLLKNPTMLEIHATSGSYSRRLRGA